MKTKTFSTLFIAALLFVSFSFPQKASAVEGLFYFYNNVYGLKNFKRNAKVIDVVAPQIYTVGYDLKVSKPSNTKIIKEAQKKDVKITPLLVNADFSKVLMSDILINEKVQDEIIEFMVDEAEKNDYAGWQFDFENINHLDRDMYADFVEKTYKVMKESNLEFSVAVIPRTRDYDPNSTNQDWSSGYDFKRIGENSDFISIMSYDDPYSVGPVASLPFTKKILDYMKTQVAPEKMSLGIPLYCWKWDDDINLRVGSLTHKLAEKEYKKGKDRKKDYDEVLGNETFSYRDRSGTNYTVWCESKESIQAKLEIIEEEGLRGFSAWALGQETSWLWRILKKY